MVREKIVIRLAGFVLFAALSMAGLSVAQAKETVVASNGVTVSVNGDDFSGRYEYTAPTIKFDGGFLLIARVKTPSHTSDVFGTGAFIYSGSWRRYDSAVFKGGEAVNFTAGNKSVGSCRYGCTLTEEFEVRITDAQLKKYAVDGVVPIQVRASAIAQTSMIEIPVAHFDAVREVSSGP